MALESTEPTTLIATYDRWAIASLNQIGDGCADAGQASAAPVALTVTLVKYRVRDDGISERSPLPSDRRALSVSDLYALAATDADVAAALAALIAAVAKIATMQGVL